MITTYNNIKDIPFTADGTWMMLGRTNDIVDELRFKAREMGYFFKTPKVENLSILTSGMPYKPGQR